MTAKILHFKSSLAQNIRLLREMQRAKISILDPGGVDFKETIELIQALDCFLMEDNK